MNTQSRLQLQSIQFPDTAFCDVEELFFHKNGDEMLFDGYFNQFQIKKWKRYTTLEQLFLTVQVCGYKTLCLYHNRHCIQELSLLPSTTSYEIAFPWDDYDDGVFWFSFIPDPHSTAQSLSGFYTGICSNLQHVFLALDICTYQREHELLRTLHLLHEKVFTNTALQVSGHLHTYIIDNGQTLHEHAPFQSYLADCHDPVIIYKNRNSGGAGGFTRGMLEILRDKEEKLLTHVLLMDDDALPNPDLFVRIYGFLCARKPEWQDITLGSSLLLEDAPHVLFASGETWENCYPINPNDYLNLKEYSNTCRDTMLTTSFERKFYCGWWCCCYSLTVVREDNLPIPLFVHHDDIEYGMRNANYGIVFLNGISVWHHDFKKILSPANLYYDTRNLFIELTQRHDKRYKAFYWIWRSYWRPLAGSLLRGNTDAVYRFVRSATDFLKGPKWLWQQDPEILHQGIRQVPRTNLLQRWYKSAISCIRLLLFGPRAIRDYQKNLHNYTNSHSWHTYLRLPSAPPRYTSVTQKDALPAEPCTKKGVL